MTPVYADSHRFDTPRTLAYSVETRRGPRMKKVIHAYITPENDGFRAQCFEPCLVTHAESLQEAINGIQQAIGLRLAGGNLHEMGFAPEPKIVIAFFLGPLRLVAQ